MSLRDKAIGFVNRAMNSKAQEILEEVKTACPRSAGGHDGKHVADSFKIVSGKGGTEIAGSFNTGGRVIKSVIIGSTELGARYANYGNGGPGRTIHPSKSRALKLESLGRDGKGRYRYSATVHGYSGAHFLEKIAAKHGGG